MRPIVVLPLIVLGILGMPIAACWLTPRAGLEDYARRLDAPAVRHWLDPSWRRYRRTLALLSAAAGPATGRKR